MEWKGFLLGQLLSVNNRDPVCRNVLSSQEVVDFISERIKPDPAGKVRPLSDIVEEVRIQEPSCCRWHGRVSSVCSGESGPIDLTVNTHPFYDTDIWHVTQRIYDELIHRLVSHVSLGPSDFV